ncbi:hypothetical protein ABBQ32_009024 [Trebouxia sp. C0010 RCD-2024]
MTLNKSRKQLPSTWDKNGLGSDGKRCLEVTGLKIKYVGPGDEDKDAASVRADYSVPFDVSLYYYEVQVVNKGRDGFVGIGFSTQDVSLNRLPGWEPHSYGYHGDDGMAFESCGTGKPYGPVFATGDIVGALLNRATKTISFTKNGLDLGVAFTSVNEDVLYPSVGLRTPDEEVVANFGSSSFTGDVSSLEADALQSIQESVQQTQAPFPVQDGNQIGMLLFDYLVHEGLWNTANRVAQDILLGRVQVSEQDRQDVEMQRQVQEHIVAGQIPQAMAVIEQAAPGTLGSHPRIKFQLLCQQFVEMVRVKDDTGAVVFGRSSLSTASNTSADHELLQDALSLIAYDEPQSSPQGYLLGDQHKLDLAATVNAAILQQKGRWPESKMERLLKQLRLVAWELRATGEPSASLLDLPKVLTEQGLRS